jgi:hypothetical protein
VQRAICFAFCVLRLDMWSLWPSVLLANLKLPHLRHGCPETCLRRPCSMYSTVLSSTNNIESEISIVTLESSSESGVVQNTRTLWLSRGCPTRSRSALYGELFILLLLLAVCIDGPDPALHRNRHGCLQNFQSLGPYRTINLSCTQTPICP